MIFQPFYFLNLNLFWSKSTTNSVRFLLFPDIENTAAYLLELLDLRLLKHGEDVGASLLSSPLSLIWGLLTRLGKQSHAPNAEFLLSVRQGQHSNQSAGDRNTAQTEKTVPKAAFHLFFAANWSYRRKEQSYHVWGMERGLPAEVWCWGGFYFRSYLTRSYNSLRWAPQPLTWPRWCRSDKRWGRLDSSELENRDKRSDDGQQVTSDVWHSEQQSSMCVFGGCNFRVRWNCFLIISDLMWSGCSTDRLSSRCRSRVSQWRNPQSEIKEIVYFNFIFYIQLQGYSQLWHVT